MTPSRAALPNRVALSLVALLCAACSAGAPGAEPCAAGSLLGPETPIVSHGVMREQWLTDGLSPPPGARANDATAAYFVAHGGFVTFDLGRAREIAALQVVTTRHAGGLLSGSPDGDRWVPLPLPDATGPGGPGALVVRSARPSGLQLRFLRVAAPPGHAVAEVLAFCRVPPDLPVLLASPESGAQRAARLHGREQIVNGVRIGLALALLALVVLPGGRRVLHAHPQAAGAVLVAVGALAWVRFGDGLGDGAWLHPWDATHYYLGAKYFPELGHTELYRCIARHEREQGRGKVVDEVEIRDLDNYVRYPGRWTATPDGACRADFSPARWQEFGDDVDHLRRLFTASRFHAALKDHGYNATPVHTAWLAPLAHAVPSTRAGLAVLAALDVVAVVVAVAVLWWAFGPLVAGLAMLVLGLGTPWSVLWVGGSMGRFAWLALLCAGLALLKKERLVAGAALVTLSGLLRLFPLVFVGALGLKLVADGVRHRRIDPTGWRLAAGMAFAGAVGAVAVAAVGGLEALGSFARNSALHALVAPTVNHLGLGVVASLGSAGSALEALRDGDRSSGVVLGSLLWGGGLLAALWFLAREVARPQRRAWEAVCLAAPLLFASIPLAGYDHVWLVVLAPLCATSCATSPRRAGALLAGLAGVDLAMFLPLEAGGRHAAASAVLALCVAVVAWRDRRGDGAP